MPRNYTPKPKVTHYCIVDGAEFETSLDNHFFCGHVGDGNCWNKLLQRERAEQINGTLAMIDQDQRCYFCEQRVVMRTLVLDPRIGADSKIVGSCADCRQNYYRTYTLMKP